jgi:hypothetical protein
MGMPGDLKIDAVRPRFVEVYRLVGEKDHRFARISPLHGARHVRPMPIAKLMRRPVVDARDVECLSVLAELHVLVAQDSDAELSKEDQPGIRPRVVFVVAGDEVGPQR